ncbi:MAG: Crp/Fnr family transcriptional regulator [Eubacteriales bacterium]|nr:Crp/Fnr family transcriptional regulator [Eubacteriales bacterium]
MLKELFNRELQQEMTSFFLNDLSQKGKAISLKKDTIIQTNSDCIYIVTHGMVSEEIFSEDGKQTTLFLLGPGTIFGEMAFFERYEKSCSIDISMYHDTKVSVIERQVLNGEIVDNPKIYNYLIHSIVRKYNILMLKVADNHFNDFKGKLASTLIRFAIVEEGDIFDGAVIRNVKSITMFAKYLSCDRSTVSKALSDFQDEGSILLDKNRIIIKNKDLLTRYVNFMW